MLFGSVYGQVRTRLNRSEIVKGRSRGKVEGIEADSVSCFVSLNIDRVQK